MKTKGLIWLVSIVMLLLLAGCGGESSQKSDVIINDNDKSMLNENNYLDLAKYYYLQESRSRNVMHSRSMQHLDDNDTKGEKNTFYIKSNRDENSIVKSMIIKNNKTLVAVTVDTESKSVKVTLHGANSESTKTLTLDDFRSFDVDESMLDEGEL